MTADDDRPARRKKLSLTVRIVIGMASGLAIGGVMNWIGYEPGGFVDSWLVNGLFHGVGRIFINLLKAIVVPVVFVSLVCGTAALEDIRKLGAIGGKTLGLYLLTTAIAIMIALTCAILIRPGAGFELTTDASFQPQPPQPLVDVIIDIFPTNPVKEMAEGNMLPIIVFAGMVGLGITLAGRAGQPVLDLFRSLNEVVMKMVLFLMEVAPVGVFALLAKVFASEGFGAIRPLAKYFAVVVLGYLLHACLTYPAIVRFGAGLSPVRFFRKMRAVFAFAFSTASSGATIPVTLRAVEERMGVHNSVAAFTIPLGATINMDGTAIMQGVATGFIAQAYGIDLSFGDYLMVILTATLASIGTAAVPSAGLITLAMVLRQVNLPVEGIALIIGVDRLLDMMRTTINVTGDAAVTLVVAKSEGRFDREVFAADDDDDAAPALKVRPE